MDKLQKLKGKKQEHPLAQTLTSLGFVTLQLRPNVSVKKTTLHSSKFYDRRIHKWQIERWGIKGDHAQEICYSGSLRDN